MKSSSSNKKKAAADKESSTGSVEQATEKLTTAKTGKPAIKSPNLFPVVGIGASAGGLDAFKKLLKAIPEDSGMAYVLVQHLDPKHESLLPELLQKVTKIPVLEITDDIKVLPDHIYVIPSNKMMVATDGVLLLAPRPAKSKTERNLPIDLFFTSLAEVHQEHAIGVVLSGTASDGTLGLKAIKDHGGITFAQDEASAEYEGMPHNAAQAGVVDFILPPGDIPKKLLEVTSKIKLSDGELQNIPKQDEDVFKQILSLLRIRKGVDFTYYKQTTVRRRILRRMVVNKNEETGEYLKFLRGNTPEQDLLYQDMLIPVTSFFRDKKVFENLCKNVFPTIIKNKIPGDITRVWVAGCSTGQEVYSFAICFKEFLDDNHERLQIFGTDLSEPAIAKARNGIYDKSELDAVSPERLKEHFTKNNGGYQVNKSIRDMCVFAHHNFLKDPPFGKMDCITCRNVLIYMEPYLQKKALTTFHYALNLKGFLLLGKSETTGGVPDLFAAVEKTDKLYTRKDVPGRFMQVASQRSEQILNRPPDSSKTDPDRAGRTDFQKTADDILLTKYTPAGVVVNEAMDIVHFRGNTGNYLEQAPGKPTHNLLMMARSGLGFELRNILHKVKAEKLPVIKENIPLNVNGSLVNISIEAVPLPNTLEPYYLVLFHSNNLTDTEGSVTGSRKKVSAKTRKDEKDIQIQLLQQELAQAREDMRSITEDQEANNEELQSANEELLSGSEELQSLNEEMETSKEELQSTNEELTVLNYELIGLNEQVTDARNYSESIVATLYQPLLVLDKHLRVKTANHAFYKTFKVNEQETEGVLIYDLGNRQWNIPELRTLLEEILPQKKQISDFEVTHNFLSIGERVILLNALEITRERKEEKLILLSIEDVTEKVSARKKIEDTCNRYHTILMESPFAFSIMKGKEMLITHANQSIKDFWGKGDEVEGNTLLQVLPELADQPFPGMLDSVYNTGKPVYANEILAKLNHNGKMEERYFNIVYQPHFEADETISGVITIAHEITNQVLARKKIEESEFRYHNMVYSSPSLIAILKGKDMIIEIANDAILESWGKEKNIIGKSLFEVMPETVEQGFDKVLLNVYNTGEPFYAYETPITLIKNGKPQLMHYTFVYQAQRDMNGVIVGVAILANEVTPQVEAKRELKESQQQLQNIFRQAPAAICVLDGPGHTYILANEGYQKMTNRTEKQLLGKTVKEVFSELEVSGAFAIFDDVYKTGKPFVAPEFAVLMDKFNDGVMHNAFFNFAIKPIKNTGEEIISLMIVAYDITEQIEGYKKIKESEAFNRAVLDSSPDCIKMLDAEGRLQFMNTNGVCLLELDDFKEVQNTYWSDMWEPDNRQIIKDAVAKAKNGKKIQLQLFGTTAKGTPKWWDIIVLPVQEDRTDKNRHRILSVSRDITKQKMDELKEKELLGRFQTLVLQAPVAICILRGKNYVIETINEGMFEMWDRTLEETINKPTFDVLPELRDQGFKELLDIVYTTGERHVVEELPISLRRNGKLENLFVKFIYEPLREADGTISGVMALAHEITEQVLSRKKIEESEKQFRQMAELMPQKVWTSDAEGNKNYFNKTLLDYAGKSFEELEGSGWQQIIHPDDWEKNKTQWEKSLSTGIDYETENRLLRKDGKYLWHLTRAVAIKDEDGKIKMWVGSKTEIQGQREEKEDLEKAVTKRTRQLQEVNKVLEHTNEELLITKEKLISEYSRSLIEASLDPFITLSTEGKISDMNKATVHILQQPREKITGTDFSGYFTEPQKAFEIYREVFAKGIVNNYPLTVKNNKLTEVLFNGSVYKDEQGKVLGAVVVARDITLQKRNEKELIEAKVLAEEEKSKAEKAAKSAEEAVISKQQFLSNMSHEIRTPMNAIIGFSSLVLKTELSAQQKEYLSAIKISGDTLIVLINDILDLAKVDAGKMTFEQIPFNLATNISAMLHLFETKTAELNIALVKEYDVNIPELLFGDPVRLHQIMLNLLSNAVKFTSKGKITVAVQLMQEEENNVTLQFTVKDTGIGIDENNLESIFENFQQASSGTTRLYGGTGLGLAIVKQLVETQGGNVQVKSKPGEGSTFSFTLNFLKTADNTIPEPDQMETDTESANIKVLLVEDMALNQLLMKTVLEDFGFECDIAVNGKMAIEKLSVIAPFGNTAVYDVILMDLHMPEMNGFEATQFIRNTLKSDIPIIAITADVTTVDLAKCKAAGMNDYIAKPIDEKLLYSKIKGLVKNSAGIKPIAVNEIKKTLQEKTTITNLDYLWERTKANKPLMIEMIELYLQQTPPLIITMKESWKERNWQLLYGSVHKLIPSFSIIGIHKDFENLANQLQEHIRSQSQTLEIPDMILAIENICTQACAELITELNLLKNN